MFTNTTLNCLGFEGTGHFHFQNNETEGVLVYQSNPMGIELYSCETLSQGFCCIICTKKSMPVKLNYTFPPIFSRKQPWFKRRGYTTHSQTTAFCSYAKTYTFPEGMAERFLNAINTDFKLKINNLSATVYNKLHQHLEACNIAQHSKESTCQTWR